LFQVVTDLNALRIFRMKRAIMLQWNYSTEWLELESKSERIRQRFLERKCNASIGV